MEHKISSIKVAVLAPGELFDAVMEKGSVSAYSVYHKDATEVTDEDIRKAILGPSYPQKYSSVEDKEQICFFYSPAWRFRSKERFIIYPVSDGLPCKMSYIVLE